jgi:tetratricopeptide (TPR) repeat protein
MKLDARVLGGAAVVALCAALLSGCNMPRSTLTVMESADRAYARGDYAKAEQEYTEYVTRRPGSAHAHHRLGLSMRELGRQEEAVEHFRIAHNLDPVEQRFTQTLAEVLLEQGAKDELYRLLRLQTRQLGRVDDFLRLGRFAALMGDPDEAEQALLTAARLEPEHPVPPVALADFYGSLGQKDREVRWLIEAYQRDRENEQVQDRLRAHGVTPGPTLIQAPTGG